MHHTINIQNMEPDQFTPEESLKLITQVISEAKLKFQENGFIYMFWGGLVAIAALTQFVLLNTGYEEINFYPYFMMPLGGIFTGIYYSRKKEGAQNQISKIISSSWIVLGVNMMILGIIYGSVLKENIVPVILILLSLGITISGVSIKSNLILYSGIFINLSAFICFNLEWIYHPLLMGLVSFVAIFIPGLILMINFKKRVNV